jgi:hypothetical protein
MRAPCPVTFVTAGFGCGFYTGIGVPPNHFCRRPWPTCGTQTLARRFVEQLQIEDGGTMGNFSPGIWTCAVLYVAIGLIGIFILTSEPGVNTSSEGYGIAAIAAAAPLR